MLGAFHMPEFTLLAPEFLQTLPARQWRCGLAEMLKTFLIADAEGYTALLSALPCTKSAENEHDPAKIAALCAKSAENEHNPAKIAASCAETPENEHRLAGWVRQAARIKAAIVERDPYEQGERAVLNLGHSFGHAIEYLAGQKGADILHGEAVAMGIVLAARVSEGLGEAPKGLARRLAEDFAAVGLPTECPYPVEELLGAIEKDKKAIGEKVKFVLLRAPGSVFLQELTPKEAYDCYLHSE